MVSYVGIGIFVCSQKHFIPCNFFYIFTYYQFTYVIFYAWQCGIFISIYQLELNGLILLLLSPKKSLNTTLFLLIFPANRKLFEMIFKLMGQFIASLWEGHYMWPSVQRFIKGLQHSEFLIDVTASTFDIKFFGSNSVLRILKCMAAFSQIFSGPNFLFALLWNGPLTQIVRFCLQFSCNIFPVAHHCCSVTPLSQFKDVLSSYSYFLRY